MNEICKILLKIGCCSSCLLRYASCKCASFFEDPSASLLKLNLINGDYNNENQNSSEEPASKKPKIAPCICCLGLLQKDVWEDMLAKVKTAVQECRYGSDTFACALTFPICILLREHSINLFLMNELPKWKPDNITSLKEAWKWSFGVELAKALDKKLDSGAVCDFLVKVNVTYAEETQELETLRSMCPSVFAEREKSFRKFHGEMFTKKGVEGILSDVEPDIFKKHFKCPPENPISWPSCISVDCLHSPIYIAGRYCKYSRELCQTPWILNGKRIMESSIQDIIFGPICTLYNIEENECNKRLKFLSSGREDVDVRCIEDGRPFVVEISEPKGVVLDRETINNLAEKMSEDKTKIEIRDLQIVVKEELSILKKGEETKTKTYVALCIKLNKTESLECNGDGDGLEMNKSNIVTSDHIDILNKYSNSANGKILVKQKTPLRVLHRRPLLVRDRTIHKMKASLVDGHHDLFTVEMTTQAGTYIKEFVHGDFGRTKPNLCEILGCKVDILALDVKSINLDWPPKIIN